MAEQDKNTCSCRFDTFPKTSLNHSILQKIYELAQSATISHRVFYLIVPFTSWYCQEIWQIVSHDEDETARNGVFHKTSHQLCSIIRALKNKHGVTTINQWNMMEIFFYHIENQLRNKFHLNLSMNMKIKQNKK